MSLVIDEDQKDNEEEPPLLAFYSNNRTSPTSKEVTVVSKEAPLFSIDLTRNSKVEHHKSKEAAEVSKEIAVSPNIFDMVFQEPDNRTKGASKEEGLVSREATQVSKEAALISAGFYAVPNEVDLVPKGPSQVSVEAALISREAALNSKEAAVVSAPAAKVASQVSLEAEMASKDSTRFTKPDIISKMLTKDSRKLKEQQIPDPNDTSGMETTE